jgi:hypothetical protein
MSQVAGPVRDGAMNSALAVFDQWVTSCAFLSKLPDEPPHGSVPSGRMAPIVASAVPIWTNAEMSALIQAASGTFPINPIDTRESFCQRGYLWFDRQMIGSVERSMAGEERHDRFHGLIWFFQRAPDESAWTLCFLTISTAQDMKDMGEDVTTEIRDAMRRVGGQIIGAPYQVPVGVEIPHNPIKVPTLSILRSFWALASQRLATRSTVHAPRSLQRQIRRAGLPVPEVSVVTLRRVSNKSDDDIDTVSSVAWSHRWIVGGHWRSQWMPSQHRHEPRWIAPYVKGPENKPLVADRVYQLVR